MWVGFDRGIGMRDTANRGITGGKGAAPIWADFMIRSTDGEPPREFPVPANIRLETVKLKSGSVDGAGVETPVTVALRIDQKVNETSVRVPFFSEDTTATAANTETTSNTSKTPTGTGAARSTITEEDLSPER